MNTENVVDFIRRGLNYEPIAKTYRSLGGKGLALCLLAVPGVLFGGLYVTISVCLVLYNILTCIMLYILSGNPEKIINRLAMNLLVEMNMGINLSACSIMLYAYFYSCNATMWLLLFPSFLLALVWILVELIVIKRNKPTRKSGIVASKISVGFVGSGLTGVSIGKVLSHNLSNVQAVTLTMACFMIVATLILSVIPQEIMRIYYYHKLKKSGIDEKVFSKTE